MKQCLISILMTYTLCSYAQAQQTPNAIRINQEGYYTTAPKWAAVTGETTATTFYLLRVANNDTVYQGVLTEVKRSPYSSLQTKLADFSPWQKPGQYRLAVKGLPPSYVFTIGEKVHHKATVALIKGFYYQRVSMPLDKKYAGKWHRPAGHPDSEVLVHASAATEKRPAGTVIASPGGWYDAGDYNKYIVNSGITMGTLLSAYEDFPQYFNQLQTNIPESNNKLPDLLDEILVNLRWMMTMQDPYDGGVYNKCTNAAFDGMVMPGVTKAPRYVVQKGTAATLDFAAVMAQGARIFRSFNKGLADSCIKAAEYAWQWALQYPARSYNQDSINKVNTPVISTGGYGDRFFADEWAWAAAELYLTTGKQQYEDVVKREQTTSLSLPAWANVRMLGHYSILRSKKKWLPAQQAMVTASKEKLIAMADRYLQSFNETTWHTVMGQAKADFIWGSSSVAANQGILLVNAYLLTNNKKYVYGALSNLDYLLGRNATGYSFITGIGSFTPMHPHHRPSVADGIVEPVPGLLAGGPNAGMQDNCTYLYKEPETAYSDTDCSYASNEIAINWNAPAVYLAAALEALIKK